VDSLVPLALILILLAPVMCFPWRVGKVRSGESGKVKQSLLYFLYSAIPVFGFVMLSFAFVGIEELMDTSLVTEGLARSLLLLTGGGLIWVTVATIVFVIRIIFMRGNAD